MKIFFKALIGMGFWMLKQKNSSISPLSWLCAVNLERKATLQVQEKWESPKKSWLNASNWPLP
jgi:hypothetical protein